MSLITYILLHPLLSLIYIVGAAVVSRIMRLFGYREHKRTEKWPTTAGKVTRVAVQKRSTSSGVDFYYFSISFSYNVDGEHYGFYKFETFSRIEAIRVEAALKTQPVLVHYDQADPLEAVLYDEELLALGETTAAK